jgi:hypothetical protein
VSIQRREGVVDYVLTSGWETLFYAIPALLLLFLSVFYLDVALVTPRQKTHTRRFFSEVVENGISSLRDPDGRPFPCDQNQK